MGTTAGLKCSHPAEAPNDPTEAHPRRGRSGGAVRNPDRGASASIPARLCAALPDQLQPQLWTRPPARHLLLLRRSLDQFLRAGFGELPRTGSPPIPLLLRSSSERFLA